MENKCVGCGRNEIHKHCPAHGTKYYMSGKKFTYFQEDKISTIIKIAIIFCFIAFLNGIINSVFDIKITSSINNFVAGIIKYAFALLHGVILVKVIDYYFGD